MEAHLSIVKTLLFVFPHTILTLSLFTNIEYIPYVTLQNFFEILNEKFSKYNVNFPESGNFWFYLII